MIQHISSEFVSSCLGKLFCSILNKGLWNMSTRWTYFTILKSAFYQTIERQTTFSHYERWEIIMSTVTKKRSTPALSTFGKRLTQFGMMVFSL